MSTSFQDLPTRPLCTQKPDEPQFEKKITIGIEDLLAWLDECRVGKDLIETIAKRLAAQPERVDKVVVFSAGHPGVRDDDQNERDLDWDDDLFMSADTEERILSEAAATLGRDLNREGFLDYGALTPREFLRVIHKLAPPAIVAAGHPRLVIYTSGSTGVPKGVVHRTLGHAVFGTYTMLVTMGPRDWDIMDTRATHSWITGLDYIAGMPGLLGVATIVAEGALEYGRWFKRLSNFKVNIAKAGAPVLRGIRAFSESRTGAGLLADLDFSALRICVNCAEPADPVTQGQVNDVFGRDKYVNTWWPTELSGPNTGAGSAWVPFPYMMKGDASTYPLPYVKQEVMADEVDPEDRLTHTAPQADGVLGRYVIDPHPGMLDGIYGDPDKFHESYFKRYWGRTGRQIWYDSGDGAIRHEDGYLHIVGRIGYAFNWNGHISGAEDLEGILRDHPAVRDVMIAPIKHHGDNLDRLQVFVVLSPGYALERELKQAFDDFVVQKKQRTFKGLMTTGADYYPVDMYPVTMSQKSLRRFGSMLGSLPDKDLMAMIGKLDDPARKSSVENGDETAISAVFPTNQDQNPYAGSLVGLGNYPALVHLTYVVARTRGLISSS